MGVVCLCKLPTVCVACEMPGWCQESRLVSTTQTVVDVRELLHAVDHRVEENLRGFAEVVALGMI